MPAPRRVAAAVVAAALVILLAAGLRIAQISDLNVPDVVRHRSVLPACGQETRTQIDGRNVDGRQCFWDAYLAGRPAEFISTRPTVEGDPITSIFRILTAGTIEVFIDQRRDRYSKGGWLRQECPGLRLNDGLSGQPEFSPGLRDGDCTLTQLEWHSPDAAR